uniref:Secreted protein n=1 Tax=Panagrellus redivivus TaxID=6233 RepID=A0A7E4UXC0_PANRE
MMFMRVCNGWAALLPTISGAICGFGQVKLFDDMLTDADVNLKTVLNSTGYHCYQFEVNTGTDSPKRKHDFKFRPYPYRPIAIAVPEHRIMFYPSDMKGLRENSWLNDDVVDFVMQDMIANLPKEDRDRITYMEPHNFSMFLGNSKLNHFDAKTIKNDM